MKKKIVSTFKNLGLSITIDMNLSKVEFLDVEFDIQNNSYKPFRKPNDNPVYIHINSNHPPTVTKQIPKSINTRISKLSSNKEIFDKSKDIYEKGLKDSGFIANFNFEENKTPQMNNKEEKKRKRKIIWFNPPYSSSVKTNVGKIFLKLISRHFPNSNNLHKIFNRNTIKVSYSCMKNIGAIIAAHNRKIMQRNDKYECNCQKPEECPVENICKTPNVVYEATVKNNVDSEVRKYIGISRPPFKDRFRNHKRDFRNNTYRTSTKLSQYVWTLKDVGKVPNVQYKFLHKLNGRSKLNFCRLCLTEKSCILEHHECEELLNKRSELFGKCRHLNRFLVANHDRFDSMD